MLIRQTQPGRDAVVGAPSEDTIRALQASVKKFMDRLDPLQNKERYELPPKPSEKSTDDLKTSCEKWCQRDEKGE